MYIAIPAQGAGVYIYGEPLTPSDCRGNPPLFPLTLLLCKGASLPLCISFAKGRHRWTSWTRTYLPACSPGGLTWASGWAGGWMSFEPDRVTGMEHLASPPPPPTRTAPLFSYPSSRQIVNRLVSDRLFVFLLPPIQL